MMKKMFLVAVLSVLVFAANAQGAETALGGTLTLSQLQYTPYPAEPGQYIDLWINVQTTSYIDSVQCKLIPQYPFSLDASENALRTIGSLGPGQSFALKYKVRIDSSAITGNNDLPVSCKSGDGDWITAKSSISIQSKAASLGISSVDLTPERIAPGSIGTVKISLKNAASSAVRGVSVKLSLADTSFTPIGGGVEKNINVILGGATEVVEYRLSPLATAESKSYRIPVAISYKDELGNSYSSNETIGIVVGETPSLIVETSSSQIIRPFSSGNVEFKIINNGLSDIKFLNIEAENGQTHEIANQNSKYIGTLAADDSETVEYNIYVGDAKGTLQIPLKLTYRDSNNKAYEETLYAPIRLYTEEELARFKITGDAGNNFWIILAAVLIAGYIGYQYWWKKRDKK